MIGLKKWKSVFFVLIAIGLVYVGILQYHITRYSHEKAFNNADYLIVLGAKVKGTVPSLTLKNRINTAAGYLKNNPETLVIASGGKGSGEEISEAECIKHGLMEKGIEESRILLEDQSTNTYENIRFSSKLLPREDMNGVVVTNTFHMYRALAIARDQHLDVQGFAAKTPFQVVLKSYSREYLAITKYYLKKIFS